MKQRGIADGWLLLIVLAAFGGALWYAYDTIDERGYERGKLEVQQRFDQYKAEVAELGRRAQARADAKAAKDRKAKELADVERKNLERRLANARRELRVERARAGGSVLPAPAPGPRSSEETITFDRKRLDEALNRFIDRVEGIVGEGAEAVDDLNTVKQWAQP